MFVDASSNLLFPVRVDKRQRRRKIEHHHRLVGRHTKIAVDHNACIACGISRRRKRLLLVILLLLKGVAELEGVVVLGGGNDTEDGVSTTTRLKNMCQHTE